MKTLKVTKIGKVGFKPTVKIFIDDDEKPLYVISRILTETTGEGSGQGIFNTFSDFKREGNTTISQVNFGEFPWEGTAEEILKETLKRKDMVISAFTLKYPDVNEVAVIIL